VYPALSMHEHTYSKFGITTIDQHSFEGRAVPASRGNGPQVTSRCAASQQQCLLPAWCSSFSERHRAVLATEPNRNSPSAKACLAKSRPCWFPFGENTATMWATSERNEKIANAAVLHNQGKAQAHVTNEQ